MKRLYSLFMVILFMLIFLSAPVFADVSDKAILVNPETDISGGYYVIKSTIKLVSLSPDMPYVLQFDLVEYPLTKAEKFDIIATRIQKGMDLKGWDKLHSLISTLQLDVNKNKVKYTTMSFYDKNNGKLDTLIIPEIWIDNFPESITQKASLAAAKYYLETHPPIKGSTL